eukprot:317438-Amphidinium_carterae.2
MMHHYASRHYLRCDLGKSGITEKDPTIRGPQKGWRRCQPQKYSHNLRPPRPYLSQRSRETRAAFEYLVSEGFAMICIEDYMPV